MRQNVFVTTSGVFDLAPFECALSYLGIDNLLFSVDDPFQDNFEAVEFLAKLPLSVEDREKLAHSNAEQLLRLPIGSSTLDSRARRKNARRAGSTWHSVRARAKSKFGRALLSFLLK
jgi:hypothetical protein